jgi:lysozyme
LYRTSKRENSMNFSIDPDASHDSTNNRQKPSNDCLNLIKEFEGYVKELADGSVQAYLDPVGIWTIGWGATRNLDEGRSIREGDIISRETAERWLLEEVEQTANVVEELCTVTITQSMFDALVSFGYNTGTGGGGLRTSTLLKKLNEKDYEGAALQFGRWVNGEVNGQKVALPGLVRRRKAEEILFRRDGLSGAINSTSTDAQDSTAPVEVRQYQPAPVPLPLTRLLEAGMFGDDCFVLNCALAGLGFLRVGPQPSSFTSVTTDAVKLFQHREDIQVNGQVGQTTKQALERSLQKARDRVAPGSPDLVFCKLTRTHRPAYQGLEECKLDFVSPQGSILDSLKVISGAPASQQFNLPQNSKEGSGEPIPQGRFMIGDIDWASGSDNYEAAHPIAGNGLGPVWVPLIKPETMKTGRDAFGMHSDWNWIKEGHSPGSAGCVCPTSMDDLKELIRLLRKHDPRVLVVYWGL